MSDLDDDDDYGDDDFEEGEDSTALVETDLPTGDQKDALGVGGLDKLDQQTRVLEPDRTVAPDRTYGESSDRPKDDADAGPAEESLRAESIDGSSFSPGRLTEASPSGATINETSTKLSAASAAAAAAATSGQSAAEIVAAAANAGPKQQEETISKLRVANAALRYQLKEFSRALDASLQTAGRATSAGSGFKAAKQQSRRGDAEARQSLRAMLATKEKMHANAKKKLEIYKKTNQELKRQLREAFNSDRFDRMNNENLEKDREIQKLLQENRSLVNMQRNQAREIERHETSREEYPARLASLGEDLRVAKEKLRMVRSKSKKAEEQHNKQHAQLVKLVEKNKSLNAELRRYEKGAGVKPKSKAQIDMADKENAWVEEKAQLKRKIAILEKQNKQDRAKANLALKKANEELQRGKEAAQRMRRKLDEKEREMRMQVLQVKKLKRHLRDMALGSAPVPTGPTPWAQNLAGYGGADEEDDDPDSEEAAAARPVPPSGTAAKKRGFARHRHQDEKRAAARAEEEEAAEEAAAAATAAATAAAAAALEEDALQREWGDAALRVQGAYRGRLGRKRARQSIHAHILLLGRAVDG